MREKETMNNQNGDTIWLSSADKKHVLTFSDKAEIERLMAIHCGNIDFEENFKEACKENNKNTESLLNDVNQVYQNYLNGIMDQFQKTLADYTSGRAMADAEYINYLSDIKRFKLEATYRQCLLEIYQVAKSASQINDFQDSQAKLNSEIPDRLKKVHEQALEYEEQVLALLIKMQKIKIIPERKNIIKNKKITIPAEYWIKTTFEDVRATLIGLLERGEIRINDIDLFMKDRLKGKAGGKISDSFRKAKSVKKREKL